MLKYELCLLPTPNGWAPRLRLDGVLVAFAPTKISRYPHEALDAAIELVGKINLEVDKG